MVVKTLMDVAGHLLPVVLRLGLGKGDKKRKIIKFVGGIAAAYIAIQLVLIISAVAYSNTDVFKTAVAFYETNQSNEDFNKIAGMGRLPQIVRIQDDFGLVVIKAVTENGHVFVQFNMRKQDGKWQVVNYHLKQQSMGKGFGISYRR